MPAADFKDGRGRREQIAADLRAEILAGVYENQLPSTIVLQRRFGGSNNTIQAALGILEAEGLVYSRQGSGTFVGNLKRQVVEAIAYYDPKTTPFKYRFLSVATVPFAPQPREAPPGTNGETVPPDIAELLGLEAGESAVRRTRLMLLKADGTPVEFSSSYYPLNVAQGTSLMAAGPVEGGSPRVLAEAGLSGTRFFDRVSTRPPTHEEALLLELPEYVSVLRTLRVVYHDDTPVEVTSMAKGGHLFDLAYSRTIH